MKQHIEKNHGLEALNIWKTYDWKNHNWATHEFKEKHKHANKSAVLNVRSTTKSRAPVKLISSKNTGRMKKLYEYWKEEDEQMCTHCGKTLKNKFYLQKHVRVEHLGTERKRTPKYCPHCTYTANDNSRLNMHIIAHHTPGAVYK